MSKDVDWKTIGLWGGPTLLAGLVGWWAGDATAADVISGREAAYNGTYGNAVSDQGFLLDGVTAAATITDTTALHLQNLTVEFWVKRANLSQASQAWSAAGAVSLNGRSRFEVAPRIPGWPTGAAAPPPRPSRSGALRRRRCPDRETPRRSTSAASSPAAPTS